MKYIISLFGSLIISFTCFSQDILTYRNGDEVKVKVIEIGTENISFKKFDNITGPTYSVLKSEVFMIKFENGTKEVFTNTTQTIVRQEVIEIDPKITYNNGRFRQEGRNLRYNVVEEYMKNSKSKDAFTIFMEGKKLHSASKPTRLIGLISGIAGTAICGLTALVYFAPANSENSDKNEMKSVMLSSGTIAIVGWATFSYGINLKNNSKIAFKKAIDQYNAVF